MKRCPQCNRLEADDSLVFCRTDGAALISDSLSLDSDTSATGAAEIETSLLPHTTAAGISRSTGPTTVLPSQSPAATTRDLNKPRRRTALVIVGALAAIAIAVSIYFITQKASTRIDSIAVLPFENRSGNPESEYLSDGLAESLIYRLSQLPNLKVSPANSVFRYKGTAADVKQIASELGVTAVMVGRMSQRGDDLSISVELIDAGNNKLLWGEQYDRKSSDLLVTQREIAATIVQKLQLRLSGGEAQGLMENIIPAAKENDVRMACHPYDPPGLPFGYQGVDQWDSPAIFAAIKRYESIVNTPYNGFQLDLGTTAAGLKHPATEVLPIVQYLARRGKIHQIHMRNIRGSLQNFDEVFPDEGEMDFLKIMRILRDTQFSGSICPDHMPSHPDDPGGLQAFAFGYGYIKALIQVVNSEV